MLLPGSIWEITKNNNLVFPIDLWNIVLYWSLQFCDLLNVCWFTKTHA
jgi:hypothetical protein